MFSPVYDNDMTTARDAIYSKLLYRHNPGAMRPKLYNVLEERGEVVIGLKLQWMHYAGMGDTSLHGHFQPDEKKAAATLVKDGLLVSTNVENHYGVSLIQRLLPFDDVQWAVDSSDAIIIYELSHNEHQPDLPDTVIRPDERHEAAIAQLQKRAGFPTSIGKVWKSAAITLKDGSEIFPILTNPRDIHLQMRHQGEGLNAPKP